MRRYRPLTIRTGARRGQALLVAVLLMMAILLVGILFVALVTYNQAQATRHEDMLAAQAMAEAGVRYAEHMIENSAEGADWRPSPPPAQYTDDTVDPGFWGPDGVPDTEDDYYTDMEIARGWAPLVDNSTEPHAYIREGFTRYPDPRSPVDPANNDMPRTVGTGDGYFLLRVSYDPPGPEEEALDTDWHIRIESIGRVEGTQVFRRLVAYKALHMFNYARLVHDSTGEGRPAYLGIPPYLDMSNDGRVHPDVDFLRTTIDGPVRVHGQLRVAGAPRVDPGTGEVIEASTTFQLRSGVTETGYHRNDRIEATRGILRQEAQEGNLPGQIRVNDDPPVLMGFTDDDDSEFTTVDGRVRDGVSGTHDGHSRFVSEVNVPTLTLGEGTTNFDRYRNLTRNSGSLLPDPDGNGFVNSGKWGFGAGIYIDNHADIQYDHDIEALIADWQRPASGAAPPTDRDSGWNALYTNYSPPAVRIEFFPREPDGLTPVEDPGDVREPGQVWWPGHEPGQPGIRISRYDGKSWRTASGTDSGLSTRMFDYPTPWLDGNDEAERYPLIVAEGNVRVSGQLPPAETNGDTMLRAYDMIVVSGGTIYIDGQLLSPNDYLDEPVADEFNTKIALLARDNVCLNTTYIVPQLTSGTAPAVPDDPLNPAAGRSHWELAPGSDGRLYSTFHWGDQPLGLSAALVVRQTAGTPGPSGVSLTTWTAADGYQPYFFSEPDEAPGAMRDTTFTLVPSGRTFPDGSSAPQPWGVTAVAPSWAPYRAWTDSEPPEEPRRVLPWDLSAYLDPTVGVQNALVLRHADPRLGGGSTSYWAKRWKIAEFNEDGLPVGAINARVNAAVYAERGCWFVLTPGYFDDEVTGNEAIRNRRYNYRISFHGTIAENFTAPVEAAQRWTDEMAYPAQYDGTGVGTLSRWGTIEYTYDETLRLARYRSPLDSPTHPAANLPRMPLLPASPDLVYYGD